MTTCPVFSQIQKRWSLNASPRLGPVETFTGREGRRLFSGTQDTPRGPYTLHPGNLLSIFVIC